jgi:hypothetical protein
MDEITDNSKNELEKILNNGKTPGFVRFILNALGGAIPFAGGIVTGATGKWSEHEQEKINKLLQSWLKVQAEEINKIGITLAEVMERINFHDDAIRERISSPEYLGLIKQVYRDWSAGDSEKKRIYLRNLLANAAESRLTSDSVISLFIKWMNEFSELHLDVISLTYKNKGITRYDMWQELYGERVREDSPEADLFKLVIDNLSMGHIIRQERLTDYYGNFLKSAPSRKNRSPVMKSAFDNEKGYELTGVGTQFVHYTMNEIVPKIENKEV